VTTYAAAVPRDRESTGLQAVLLDMDGTLVDTEDLWWEAELTLLAELGHRLDHIDRQAVVGGPMSRVVDHLLAVSGLTLTADRLGTMINDRFAERIAHGVPLRPGAAELLADLAAEGVPAALVSASHRRIIDLVLRTLGSHHFAFTVAGDEVARTKPQRSDRGRADGRARGGGGGLPGAGRALGDRHRGGARADRARVAGGGHRGPVARAGIRT
jgi:hypothetical protein